MFGRIDTPVVKAVAEGAARVEEEQAADQLEFGLVMPPTRFLPGDERHDELVATVKRNHFGRPPGARNIRTQNVLKIIGRLFGDPLLERARYLSHTPESLARELDCDKLTAFQLLDKIRHDLAMFIHPRLAPVDARGVAVAPSFTMNVTAGGPAARQVTGADTGSSWPEPGWDRDIDEFDQEVQQQLPSAPARENGGA